MVRLNLTGPRCAVLQVFLDAPSDARFYGLEVADSCLPHPRSTIYRILETLERQGWLVSEWDTPSDKPRARRRYYRLTSIGRVEGAQYVSRGSES